VRSGCSVCSCRQQLKYIIKKMHMTVPLPLPPQPDRAAGGSQPCRFVITLNRRFVEHSNLSLCPLCSPWFILKCFQPSTPFFSSPAAPPLAFTPPGCPPPVCSTLPCGVGAGSRFRGALWMHGYPAVRGCEVKAIAVESFTVFAHFAVNQIIKPSPHPFFGSSAAPYPLHSARVLPSL